MTKRSSLGLLMLVLLMLALVACGGGGDEPADTGSSAGGAVGDPEAGQQVYVGEGGCGACHVIEGVEGANGVVGPDHTHLAIKAAEVAEKVGAASAEEYIRESIVDPSAYIAEDCPTGPCAPGTMPQNLKDQLTEEQINDLVAFLMQQK